ncbi:mediator of RNA polymerase II transcription subunit 10 [Cordyceps militaris CM01]|uniref:Mediator of RNA polymerase II transcription subunit 10 n=2 Tax=Cordyceps militaris TaxID=73501 RepID=G3J5N2_CORMM|nr:mediator of RNA polymerase II transcription subunit 10 [Cordyceps militaris CM01]ATY63782.1 mediator of RNA polymerase II transcription subunit 10 [Cordyceps militaris]EGX96888.1 mediator of RNA polymerase II transcription subunit 10 [Cordyceps militaris CM01]
MAPIDSKVDHDGIEQQLKDIIQDLYQVMVQVSTYDSMGRPSKEVLSNEIKTLSRSLNTLHTTASAPHALPSVPPELLEYVENGRNPDIYTREFVELVRRGNQLMAGKMGAFGSFRDVLAHNMATAMPELRDDVARVLDATGGPRTTAAGVNGTAAALGGGASTSYTTPAELGSAAPAAAVAGTGVDNVQTMG